MPRITSRQHPLVKQFRSVARGDAVRILLDGWHLVAEAVAAGLAIDTLALAGDAPRPYRSTVARAARAGARVVDVSAAVLAAVSPVHTPGGVVAIATRPAPADAALAAPAPALILAAVGIQDPGNVGAIVRAADAGGATGVAVDRHTADPWGWKALRAAMGSTFRLPVARVDDVAGACRRWTRAGLRVAATTPAGGTSIYAADLSRGLVVMLGGEGGGVPADLLELADLRLTIPMRPPVESLNVAVAAALIVYEARRQRTLTHLTAPDRT